MGLLFKHWASIAVRRDADTEHSPLLLGGDDAERGLEWADGFLTGVDLGAEAWDPLYDDRRGAEVVMAIHALLGDDPEVFEERITPKVRAEILERLPALLQLIAAYWRHPDLRMPPREPVRSTKVGRNEPCPCGSAKKYKKCCGSATPPVLH